LTLKDLPSEAPDPTLAVVAPADIRNSVAVLMPDETAAERKRRDDVFFAILSAAGR
jgi:hypothetical protein